MIRRALAASWLALAALAGAAPPPLPQAVHAEFPELKPYGEGRLRYFGLHVYDASVWVPGASWSPKDLYALELRYEIRIKGRALTERSLEEMRGQGWTDEAQLKRWEVAMDRVFPDLKAGDRLVGVHVPGREARFYDAGRFLGRVEDPEFARAFFGIWLDEKTSQPALRAKLLKLRDP